MRLPFFLVFLFLFYLGVLIEGILRSTVGRLRQFSRRLRRVTKIEQS